MKALLQLVRWPNLLLVAVAQVLFKYAFLPAFQVQSNLVDIDFILLCLSIVLVTASGNIINDIHDIKTDFINQRKRPLATQKISFTSAYSAYFIFNGMALLISCYLSLKYNLLELSVVLITVMILLYLYSKFIKNIPLFGNVLVSVLVSLSFLLIIYIELFLSPEQIVSVELRYWIAGYGIFAFWANLNREWIKDVTDIRGDYVQGISTLPILIGKSRMNILIFVSTLLLIVSLIAGVKIYFQPDLVFILYLTFGLCAPLSYVLFHVHQKGLNTNYNLLSHLYKVIMLIGIFSLILFKL